MSKNHALCEESTEFTGNIVFDTTINIRYGAISKNNVDGIKFSFSCISLLNSYIVKNREISGSLI